MRRGPLRPIFNPEIQRGQVFTGAAIGESVITPPPELDFVAGMASPCGIVASGDYLFIADPGDDNIFVVDKTDPSALSVVGGFGSVDSQPIALLGSHIYVVQSSLLRAYSISTPTSPSLVGSTGTAVGNSDLVASGNRVYTSSISADRIHNVDVSTPASPSVTSSLTNSTTLNGAYGLAFQGSHVYVACQDGDRLTSVNISVPATMVVADNETHADLDGCVHVQINLDYCYVVSPVTGKLVVYNKSTPTALTYVTSVDIPNAMRIEVGGDHAYVLTDDGIGAAELVIVNITNPAAPVVIPEATVTGLAGVRDLVMDDDVVYVTDVGFGGVWAFDVSSYP